MKFTKNLAALAVINIAFALSACAESSHPSSHGSNAETDQRVTAPAGSPSNDPETETSDPAGHAMHLVEASTSTEAELEPGAAVAAKQASSNHPEAVLELSSAIAASTSDVAVPPAPEMRMSVKTSIADREILTGAVSSIKLAFGHEMRLTGVTLSTLTGETIPVEFDSKSFSERTSVTFETLQADDYAFTWRADAGDHEMSGTVRFTVEK